MEDWNQYLNKFIKVIVEDTNFPKKKLGILINVSDTHLFLKTNEKVEIILLNKILRVEVEND